MLDLANIVYYSNQFSKSIRHLYSDLYNILIAKQPESFVYKNQLSNLHKQQYSLAQNQDNHNPLHIYIDPLPANYHLRHSVIPFLIGLKEPSG